VFGAWDWKNAVIVVWRKGATPLTFQEKIRRLLGGSDGTAGDEVMVVSGLLLPKVLRRKGGGLISEELPRDLLPIVDIVNWNLILY